MHGYFHQPRRRHAYMRQTLPPNLKIHWDRLLARNKERSPCGCTKDKDYSRPPPTENVLFSRVEA